MPPKKKAAKAKPKPAADASTTEANAGQDLPATETAEPPRDATQPSTGDIKTLAKDDATAGASNGTTSAKKDDPSAKLKGKPATAPKASKKRKQHLEPESSSKSSRRSGRGVSKPQPSQQQLLNYLLSKDAEELLRPEDEKNDVKERGNIRTYSSAVMNPFEELVCAMILSRPISHKLGLRAIRTVMNDPYNFSTPQKVKDAGEEKRHQALWDAKTQHKGKTADQLGQVAEVVLNKYTSSDDKDGTQLKKALADNDNNVDKALASLQESIKGLGRIGVDIFLRRVQWLSDWQEAYPYTDGRSKDGLRDLGLPQDGDELQAIIHERWNKLDTKHIAADDEEVRKRRAFVIILERATGAHLDDNISDVLAAAAA